MERGPGGKWAWEILGRRADNGPPGTKRRTRLRADPRWPLGSPAG
ncbi:MAG: hypothetical protein WED34_22130 [Planctomycetales bacterium]